MALLAEGLTSGQIGRRMDVSPRTVEKHLEHIHAKLGVTNRVEALAAFRAFGATLMHVPTHWIVVMAIVLSGLGIVTGVKATRQKDSSN